MVDLENQEVDIVNIEGWLKVFQEDFSKGRLVRKKKSKSLFLQVGISLEYSDLIAMKIREPGLDTTCEFLLKGENFTILAKNCSIQHRYDREIEILMGYFVYSVHDFNDLHRISIQSINVLCTDKSPFNFNSKQLFLSEERFIYAEEEEQEFKVAYIFPKTEKIDNLQKVMDEMNMMIIFFRLYFYYYLNVESVQFYDEQGAEYIFHLNDHVYNEIYDNRKASSSFPQEKVPAIYEEFRKVCEKFGNWIFAVHSMEKDRFYDNKIRWAVTGLEVYVRWVLRNTLKKTKKDFPELTNILTESIDVHLRRKLLYILRLDFIKMYYIDRYETDYYDLGKNKKSRDDFINDAIDCRNGLVHLEEDYSIDVEKDKSWELYMILNRLNYLLLYKELNLDEVELDKKLFEIFDLYKVFKRK